MSTTEEQVAGVTGVRLSRRSTPITSSDVMGYILYIVTFHQFFHILTWATNAITVFPMLSYVFPHSIDGTDQWLKHVFKYDYYPMILTDVPLMLLWFFHHSLFARVWMQQKVASFVSRELERILYVATSTTLTQFLIYSWQPMPHTIWSVEGPLAIALQSLCLCGFLWTALTCITIAHNDLFGYREAFTGIPARYVPRHLPLVYQYTRIPLWLGTLSILWAASEMSAGRLLFALGMTIYAIMAGRVQDKDYQRKYGKEYEDYQHRVSFLPFLKW